MLLKDSQSRSEHKVVFDKIAQDIKSKFQELKSKNELLEKSHKDTQLATKVSTNCPEHGAEITKLRSQLDRAKSQMKSEAKTEKDLLQ